MEIECQLSSELVIALDLILNVDYNFHRIHKRCKGDGQRLWRYHNEFRRLGLWPLSTALGKSSIAAVCKSLESYDDKPLGDCSCDSCQVNIRRDVRNAGLRAMRSFTGLCLVCMKLGATDVGLFRDCPGH